MSNSKMQNVWWRSSLVVRCCTKEGSGGDSDEDCVTIPRLRGAGTVQVHYYVGIVGIVV